MDIVISIENFEDTSGNYREINSPRTLEACLRSGLDPAELYPKPSSFFQEKGLTNEMIEIKASTFEKKRQDKVEAVKKERGMIVQYTERKMFNTFSPSTSQKGGLGSSSPMKEMTAGEKASAMLEMEEKRMEALRRRQEKELSKIVEREQTMAQLQLKIKRAEDEERKKKKIHDKKVAEMKMEEEKKRIQREQDLKRKEIEEAEKKKELERKEAEVAEKLRKRQLQIERQIAKEARERDEERKQKIEEHRKQTAALLKMQEGIAEQNRLKMFEREHRILSQLEAKKEAKRIELQEQRDKAAARIAEALEKHHQLYEKRREDFNQTQRDAALRAKENAMYEREKLKQQADDRDKRNQLRVRRLIDAYKIRKQHRQSIVDRRMEKEKVYSVIQEERDRRTAMLKFTTTLKLQDKLENVERVARVNEFHRLQILQRIESEDQKYEEIQSRKEELMKRHREEAKLSLIRKHEISDVMDTMRMTNDFSLLDKLFASKNKGRKDRERVMTSKNTEDVSGLDGVDERLAQTV